MKTLLKTLGCLALTAALGGLSVSMVFAGASGPGATGAGAAGVGSGANTSGNGGVNGAVNGNRNPNRRNPDIQQPATVEPTDNGGNDALQQQRQQSGEQMIQERKMGSSDTR